MSLRYYEAELAYLLEAGRQFAQAHPDRARYLNTDAVEDRDPYVERLFEGFALLSGRVHERLDDDLPEYTQRLVGLLYPQFLKPVPSCTVVELAPKEGRVQAPTVLPRGTGVRSAAVGPEGTVCHFQTTQDVRLQPLVVAGVETAYASDETSRLSVRFRTMPGARLSDLDLSALRLYLHADGATASTGHWMLTRHTTRVAAWPSGPAARATPPTVSLGSSGVRPAGLRKEEALLPHGPETPAGLRLLQEYLSFRPKFWQVDLVGLAPLVGAHPDAEGFEVEVAFDRPYPENRQLREEHVRLYCSPAINLFDHDAEPTRVDHARSEVRVAASYRRPRTVVPYDVKEVVGVSVTTGEARPYARAFSLDAAQGNGGARAERTYSVIRRQGVLDRPELVLTLASPEISAGAPPPETLSVALRCTNGSLPNEALHTGGLTQLDPAAPQVATPTNLGQPTLIRYPPLGDHRDLFWAFISHWAFNHQSVATKEAVVGLLDLYDWTGSEGNRRRRRGVRSVEWGPQEEAYRGAVRRGARVTISVEDTHFPEEADASLLGLVLSEFFALYATLNAFVHLELVFQPSNRRMVWAPAVGVRPPV